jgi:muramidase (phage lysozyme)
LGEAGPSDRRWKKIANLLRAAAFLHGRRQITIADMGVLPYCLWNRYEQWPQVQELCSLAIANIWYAAAPAHQHLLQTLQDYDPKLRPQNNPEPMLIDDEYYLIEALDGPSLHSEYRLWHLDYAETSSKAKTTEIFCYEHGILQRTEHWNIARGPRPWTFLCDQKLFGLVCTSPQAKPASNVSSQELPPLSTLQGQYQILLEQRSLDETALSHSLFTEALLTQRLFDPWNRSLQDMAAKLHLIESHGQE